MWAGSPKTRRLSEQGLIFIGESSQTSDEAAHIAAGYSYLKTADFRLNPEHPPLIKEWAALPLLFFDLQFPWGPLWNQAEEWNIGRIFVHENRVPNDTILLFGRLPILLLSLVLGWFLFRWGRTLFGARGAPASALEQTGGRAGRTSGAPRGRPGPLGFVRGPPRLPGRRSDLRRRGDRVLSRGACARVASFRRGTQRVLDGQILRGRMVVLLPLRVPDQNTSRHAPHRGGVSSVLGAVAPDSPQGRALPVDPDRTCRPDHLPVESEHRTPAPPADLSLPIPGRRAARHAASSRELRRRETLACSSGRRVRRRMPGLECHRGGEDRSLSSRLFQRAGRRAGQREIGRASCRERV